MLYYVVSSYEVAGTVQIFQRRERVAYYLLDDVFDPMERVTPLSNCVAHKLHTDIVH